MTVPDELRDWLAEVLPGPFGARPLAGGFRNDTLVLTSGADRFVLRSYRGAGRAAVEAALARRVRAVVPVPEVLAEHPRGRALLLAHVPGTPGDRALAALHDDPVLAERLGRRVGAALAALGTVHFGHSGSLDTPDLVPSAAGLPDDLAGFVAHCMTSPHVPLPAAQRSALVALARRWAPLVADARGDSLVHSDFNPKNLLVARDGDDWSVRAVLDWEFAFSGSPLVDVGNMLRFAASQPPGYPDGFAAGFRTAGGVLPDRWRETARALDLFAVADLLTRETPSPVTVAVTGLVRTMLG